MADAELNEVLEQVKARAWDEERRELLERSQEAWLSYRRAQAELFADEARGGTLAPQLEAMEEESLTKDRIKKLRWYLEKEFP